MSGPTLGSGPEASPRAKGAICTTDADCVLDERAECVVCGVHHGAPCHACGQRGYHLDYCPVLEDAQIRSLGCAL